MSNWYDTNASKFIRATQELDVQELQGRFLKHLPRDAYILDAGCGSGRDLKLFAEAGYRTLGIDSSTAMVREARSYSRQEVIQTTFQDFDFENVFDGIWACASLLHVPLNDLPEVLSKLRNALLACGVLYVSFKSGEGETFRNGRQFTNFTKESLAHFFSRNSGWSLLEIWDTSDIRPGRETEIWINATVRKLEI